MQTRAELLSGFARRARDAGLGLFVGSGFSRHLTAGVAPSWSDLLRGLFDRIRPGIDPGAVVNWDELCALRSEPQIASELEKMFVRSGQGLPFDFRCLVAELCDLPLPDDHRPLGMIVRAMGPSWVLTTNYDQLLESLLEPALPVLPGVPFTPSQETVPVVHLHGSVQDPTSLVVTEEDYVSQMTGGGYTKQRLPLMFSECAVLVLGYSLADINVRIALREASAFSNQVPWVVHGEWVPEVDPAIEPYRGPDGQWVVQYSNASDLLEEVGQALENLRIGGQIDLSEARRRASDDVVVNAAPGDPATRRDAIEDSILVLTKSGSEEFFVVADRYLDAIWAEARATGGWAYYTVYLDFVVQLMLEAPTQLQIEGVIRYFAARLDRVCGFLDHEFPIGHGHAYDASIKWRKLAPKIPHRIWQRLRWMAGPGGFIDLRRMIESLRSGPNPEES